MKKKEKEKLKCVLLSPSMIVISSFKQEQVWKWGPKKPGPGPEGKIDTTHYEPHLPEIVD